MRPKSLTKIVIGWDVRGWMSSEQAVAVLAIKGERIEWLGFAERFRLQQSVSLKLSSLLGPVFENTLLSAEFADVQIIIAIDAPLAFSTGFRSLVGGNVLSIAPPKTEIENPLAYRACERWVKESFGKKPLSAAFDKLGNNASVAIALCQALKDEGFAVVPQDAPFSAKGIIEVYPGITKSGPKRIDPAILPIAEHIPNHFIPGTDIYDAAICALLGAVYAGWGTKLDIPELVQPLKSFDKSEGWIFCLPPKYVRAFCDR
jgi:hypothetical protein